MKVVLDASVLIKWLLADPEREAYTEKATELVMAVGRGELDLILPGHWLVEVAAVLCRISPQTAQGDVETLHLLDWPTLDTPSLYRVATRLAVELRHHLFDTLYHATALETGATLVTADAHYWRKAGSLGRITLLSDFTV
ncbi:hypothetical protein MIT9_P2579 [Methylomarinovum caldicuralii]|uniref:PIN domain-containing protein n=1 Tax=Methylomarinovum caldicuralii TaxID=438856 RepID=A0AAU9CSL0_9GAMM|nr:type II toxin-antitoxin system VapC family toxin [Methylomarinovum caldicuralii]BCX82988.1 hypothetical protein MIT9_P2579 [Methylomarinovum caldicuralii]